MSKETAVIALGLWVIVMPYLGVPRAWLTALMIVTAVFLIVLGFLMRAEVLSRGARHTSHHHPFAEHMPHEEGGHIHDGHERKERLSSLN